MTYTTKCISIDTNLEVVGLMAHPLASIAGITIYIIWEVVDLMVHPLASIAGIKIIRSQIGQARDS